jgi:hypothetical protein
VRRSCERVGCAEPAAIAYGIDIGTLVVWLEHASADAPHHMNVLCERHAERLILPRGWSIDDRREGTSRLFVAAQRNRVTAKGSAAGAKNTGASRGTGAKASNGGTRRQRDVTTQLRVVTNEGLFDPTVPMASPPRDATGAAADEDTRDATQAAIDEETRDATQTATVDATGDDATPGAAGSTMQSGDVTRSHPSGERRFFDRATANHTRPVVRPSDASRAMFRDTTGAAVKPDDTYDFNQGDHVE